MRIQSYTYFLFFAVVLANNISAHDFGFPVPPVDRLFTSLYGDWASHTAADWTAQYEKHDADVAEFFKSNNMQTQLLNVSFTQGEGWERLAPFLGVEIDAVHQQGQPFPRADVFDVSAKLQPLWQLANLWRWVDYSCDGDEHSEL